MFCIIAHKPDISLLKLTAHLATFLPCLSLILHVLPVSYPPTTFQWDSNCFDKNLKPFISAFWASPRWVCECDRDYYPGSAWNLRRMTSHNFKHFSTLWRIHRRVDLKLPKLHHCHLHATLVYIFCIKHCCSVFQSSVQITLYYKMLGFYNEHKHSIWFC